MKYTQIKFIILFGLISFMFIPGYVFASEITSGNMLRLLNEERAKRGITRLRVSDELNNAALLKSKDMVNRDYFDHYAFGLTPWDFIKNSGYDYLYAGENLAMDFFTAEGMVNAWMQSDTHRDNILNPNYSEIGLGVVKGEYIEDGGLYGKNTIIVTNMFGRKKPTVLKVFNNISKTLSRFF